MKYTFKTTLEYVSLSGAKLQGFELGDGTIEYRASMGRGLKELAPFFGKTGAVRVTFEADEPAAVGASHGASAPASASKPVQDERLCLCPATSEYDPPCPAHGVLGIGVTGRATATAPPIVDGRPSCCEKAASHRIEVPLISEDGFWTVAPSNSANTFEVVVFCPFCGARLPEVPR